MKLGSISKYLKEAGVDTVSNERFELPPFQRTFAPTISLEEEGNWLTKLIERLKQMFSKVMEWFEDSEAKVEQLVLELREEVKEAGPTIKKKNPTFDVPGTLMGVMVKDQEFDSEFFKDNMRKLDAIRKAVNDLSKRVWMQDSVAKLTESFKELEAGIKENTEKFISLAGQYSSVEGDKVETNIETVEAFDRILATIGLVSTETTFTALDTRKVEGQFKNVDGVDQEELNEALVAQKAAMDALQTFGKTRLKYLMGLIRQIQALFGSFVEVSKENLDEGEIVHDDFEAAHVNEDTAPLGLDTQPDNALFKQLHTIATESFTIGNFARYFSRKADSLNIAVQEGFKYLTTYNYEPMETLHPMEMSNYTSTMDFFDHEAVKVPQPVGFKGELLPYTALLIERAQIMNKVLDNVIKPATSRFGHYLSMPMDRAERRDFEFGVNIQDDRDTMVKEDAKLFGGNRSGQASLGALFNSFNDFVDAERNMGTVKATLGEGGMDQVKKAVQALTITAQALIKRLGQDTTNKPSGEFVRMISDQLTEVAKWVEWYSGQMTRIIETNNAIYAAEKAILAIE